jgi:putative type-1 restriction enzyme hindVIIP specificity protein
MSKLGDHIEYVKGFAFKSKDYTETGIPVIRVSNFTDNSIDIKDVYHIPKERFSEFQKVNLIKDDIVIATVGSWPTNPSSVVGKTIRVPPEANNTLLNQNAVRIRGLDKDEQLYFYYVLKDKSFSDYIISTAQGSANQASITLKSILDYDLPNIDSKEKRIKIGKTLATYDEKIQLNTLINQTLEQIAQALFKSWFVDFDPVRAKVQALSDGLSLEQAELAAMQTISGKTPVELTALSQTQPDRYAELAETAKAFPCEMVEVDGVEVPKGWKYCSFGDVSECFDSKRIPLSKQQREKRKGNIPYYGATSVMDYVDEAIFDDIYLLVGEDGSVLKEDGTPFTQYIWGKSWVNNHAHVLKGKNGISTEHLMIFIQQTNISAYITGAVQLKLNQKNMNSIPFLKANNEINVFFAEYIESLYAKIRENLDENKILETARDLLLPKLLNGDI